MQRSTNLLGIAAFPAEVGPSHHLPAIDGQPAEGWGCCEMLLKMGQANAAALQQLNQQMLLQMEPAIEVLRGDRFLSFKARQRAGFCFSQQVGNPKNIGCRMHA